MSRKRSRISTGVTGNKGSQNQCGAAARYACEILERRLLLTSTLYIDYGDSFPGGVLNTTIGALKSTTNGSNPNVSGPQLTDGSGSNYSDGTAIQITSLNNLYGASAAAMRATMDALVQRFYAPFNITVVDLTGSSQSANGHPVQAATSLNDVSATLGANNGDTQHNDSYVIVGQYLIGASNDNPATFASNGYGGIANGSDIGGNNNTEGTACVLLIGSGDGVLFNGDQIAHESGHLFGFRHVYRQNVGSAAPSLSNTTATGAQYDKLESSELMSYLGYDGFDFFSRFPTMKGDGNTDANTLSTSPTPYDHLIGDSNVGPSNFEYVTGTGENNIITITKGAGSTGNVSVQAFDDTSYTTAVDAPGGTGNTYSYTIDLTKPLVIDAGRRNDRIVLDGDLGTTITVRGMNGTDTLVVDGKNAAAGTYTSGTNNTNGLDGNSDLRGSVVIGSTTINFQEFEAASTVTIQNLGTLTFRTGGSSDNVTMDWPGAGQNRITGTSDAVPIVPLIFSNVTNFVIDTGTNDAGTPGDRVNISLGGLATGLQQISVSTGAGNDTLDVDFTSANPIPVNGLSFDGGSGTGDKLFLHNGSFTNEVDTATGPGSGTITLDGSSVITYSNLSPIDDTLSVTNFTLNATAGGDDISLGNGPVVGAFQAATIKSTNGTFELVNFANKANVNVNGQGGADTYALNMTVAPNGLATLSLNGQNATNSGDDNASDAFNLGAAPSGVSIVVQGGGGNDTINVGSGNLNSLTGAITVDGGLGTDSISVNDQGSGSSDTYNITSSSLTRTGFGGLTYVNAESLSLNAETSDNTINVNSTLATTPVTVNANGGNDIINLGTGNLNNLPGAVTVDGGAGGDTINLNDQGTASSDAYLVTSTTVTRPIFGGLTYSNAEALVLNAENGNNVINVGSTATFAATTINAGDGADTVNVAPGTLGIVSVLNLNGQGGDDTFNLTSSAVAPINLDGGSHIFGDTLNVDGELLDYTINAASFTTAGRQPINFVNVETLNLANGTFGVPATIAPAVNVNTNAKLYGVGTVLGPVTTTTNGVISPGINTGSGTGILNTGSLLLAPTSSYQVQLNGLIDGVEHDVLNVTGTVNLGGANLDATASITAVPGDEIMILHNAGSAPVLNKFAQGDMITIGSQKFAIDYQYDGDGDGQNNDVALIRYGAALAPDPCDPTKMALFVSATTGNDVIRFISVQGNNLIHVLINSDDFGNFSPTGLLIAFGQAGDDKITVEVPSRASWVYGQAGNDLLITGNNDSVLIGGNGNDHLIGGNGKDILIGGKGADNLEGGNGDDLLISGSTSFDTNNAANRKAICAIDDEWTGGTGGWKGHVDHLTAGGGLNGAIVLNSTDLFDDADVDTVSGQNGKDWLLFNSGGGGVLDISDATKQEIVTDL